jgi:hypothetical protein
MVMMQSHGRNRKTAKIDYKKGNSIPLMTADGIGIALVVADLYMERYFPRSLQL